MYGLLHTEKSYKRLTDNDEDIDRDYKHPKCTRCQGNGKPNIQYLDMEKELALGTKHAVVRAKLWWTFFTINRNNNFFESAADYKNLWKDVKSPTGDYRLQKNQIYLDEHRLKKMLKTYDVEKWQAFMNDIQTLFGEKYRRALLDKGFCPTNCASAGECITNGCRKWTMRPLITLELNIDSATESTVPRKAEIETVMKKHNLFHISYLDLGDPITTVGEKVEVELTLTPEQKAQAEIEKKAIRSKLGGKGGLLGMLNKKKKKRKRRKRIVDCKHCKKTLEEIIKTVQEPTAGWTVISKMEAMREHEKAHYTRRRRLLRLVRSEAMISNGEM